jgi:hypothetical protein
MNQSVNLRVGFFNLNSKKIDFCQLFEFLFFHHCKEYQHQITIQITPLQRENFQTFIIHQKFEKFVELFLRQQFDVG